MPKKTEPRFDDEQRRLLAILHEEIDDFNLSFADSHLDDIVYTLHPPTPSKKKENLKRRVPPKKDRHIYMVPFFTLSEKERSSYDIFHSRMMIITNNIPVRSITNKLISFHPEANYLTISSTLSHRNFSHTHGELLNKKEAIEALEEPSGNAEGEIRVLERLLSFMEQYNEFSISGRTHSDNVTYSVYDEENTMTVKLSYFRGGVVIPKGCQVREPFVRQSRSDNDAKGKEIVYDGSKSYILDPYVQYEKKRENNLPQQTGEDDEYYL